MISNPLKRLMLSAERFRDPCTGRMSVCARWTPGLPAAEALPILSSENTFGNGLAGNLHREVFPNAERSWTYRPAQAPGTGEFLE
jgi:hypothetical protein